MLGKRFKLLFFLSGTAVQSELAMLIRLESGRGRKTLPLLFVSAKENQVDTCHLR